MTIITITALKTAHAGSDFLFTALCSLIHKLRIGKKCPADRNKTYFCCTQNFLCIFGLIDSSGHTDSDINCAADLIGRIYIVTCFLSSRSNSIPYTVHAAGDVQQISPGSLKELGHSSGVALVMTVRNHIISVYPHTDRVIDPVRGLDALDDLCYDSCAALYPTAILIGPPISTG